MIRLSGIFEMDKEGLKEFEDYVVNKTGKAINDLKYNEALSCYVLGKFAEMEDNNKKGMSFFDIIEYNPNLPQNGPIWLEGRFKTYLDFKRED